MKEARRSPSAQETSRIIDRLIVRLWETIDELEHLEPPQDRFFRVAIFGSARIEVGDPAYERVRAFARKIGGLGCDIVTGGGPGLMAAANEGAKQAYREEGVRIRSYGLTIDLPREEEANPFVDRVTAHRTFFSRLHHFVRMSHAYVVFPGGIGTSLETFMIWQLLQVGHLSPRPLVFVGGMYRGLIDWMQQEMVPARLVSGRELEIAVVIDDDELDRAVEVIGVAKARFDEAKKRMAEERAESGNGGNGGGEPLPARPSNREDQE